MPLTIERAKSILPIESFQQSYHDTLENLRNDPDGLIETDQIENLQWLSQVWEPDLTITWLEHIQFTPNLANATHVLLLKRLVEVGQINWVKQHLDTTKIVANKKYHLELLTALTKQNEVNYVADILVKMHLDFTLWQYTELNELFQAMAMRGRADLVQTYMTTARNMDPGLYYTWLKSIARYGDAHWVTEQLSAEWFTPEFIQQQQALIAILVSQGELAWVESKIQNAPLNVSVAVYKIIIEISGDSAAIEWIKVHMDDIEYNTEFNYYSWLCLLARNGQQAWVKQRTADLATNMNNPKNRSDYIALLQTMAECGEATWVRQRLDHRSPGHTITDRSLTVLIQTKLGEPVEFTADEITQTRGALENQTDDIVLRLERYLLRVFKILPNTNPNRILRQRILQAIFRLPANVLPLLTLAIRQHGVLSKAFMRALDAIEERNRSFSIGMAKTGSQLKIYGQRHAGSEPFTVSFVNVIKPSAAQAWQQAVATGIPVAPILNIAQRPGSTDQTRVYSRYCGFSISQLAQLKIAPSLLSILDGLRQDVLTQLRASGLHHGHPHEGNFTIEFVQQSYWQEQRQSGKNVNTIDFDPNKMTFDVIAFMQHPEQWKPIVRLIDWDQAQTLTNKNQS